MLVFRLTLLAWFGELQQCANKGSAKKACSACWCYNLLVLHLVASPMIRM
jgi:hypothetical protein